MATWLMIAAGDARQHAGNDGYDDLPSSHYSWDNTVANHALPAVGDTIVLWDKKTLLGLSIIERIDRGRSTKIRRRCPACGQTKLKHRKSTDDYRCYACKEATAEGEVEHIVVDTYTSRHARSWVDLYGVLDGPLLRQLCVSPRSQHSLRPMDAQRLAGALAAAGHAATNGLITTGERVMRGGHALRLVRVRRGQRSFRSALLRRDGSTCAFTGQLPEEALEAAHLYSYATVGDHQENGGLLLRRDLHRLFDLGLILVDEHATLWLDPAIRRFEAYRALHGGRLHVDTTTEMMGWFRLHMRQHRFHAR